MWTSHFHQPRSQLSALSIICAILTLCNGENFNSELSAQDLGTAYEFKIYVDAGKEDCFYQHVEAGSSLYVAFQVRAC